MERIRDTNDINSKVHQVLIYLFNLDKIKEDIAVEGESK